MGEITAKTAKKALVQYFWEKYGIRLTKRVAVDIIDVKDSVIYYRNGCGETLKLKVDVVPVQYKFTELE